METMPNRLLLAVDGSNQSQLVVDYVGTLFPPDKTHVVLFHVLSELPEVLWDMERNAEQYFQLHSAHAWMSEQKKMIREFLSQSKQTLLQKGFAPSQVETVIEPRKKGIARDILHAVQDGFDALVIGRFGKSRVKDFVVGSIATKLLGKMTDITMIVVGKEMVSPHILLAYDASEGADRALYAVCKFMGNDPGKQIRIVNVVRSVSMFYFDELQGNYPIDEMEWTEKHRETIEPALDRAMAQLVEAGISRDNVSKKVLTDQISRAGAVIDEARENGFGTIVVGRRGLSFVEEFFLGRVGKKIFQMGDDRTIWIVN